jgi:hypothetical protein
VDRAGYGAAGVNGEPVAKATLAVGLVQGPEGPCSLRFGKATRSNVGKDNRLQS